MKQYIVNVRLFLFVFCMFAAFAAACPAECGAAKQGAKTKTGAKIESGANAAYLKARIGYEKFVKDPGLCADQAAWQRVIRGFRAVYFKFPNDPGVAPKVLYMLAVCYKDLYGHSRSKRDLEEAIKRCEVLVERFPESGLAGGALYLSAGLYLEKGEKAAAKKALERVVEKYPGSGEAVKAARRLKDLGGAPVGQARGEKPVSAAAEGDNGKAQAQPGTARKPSVRDVNGALADAHEKGPAHVPETDGKLREVTDIRHWSVSDYTRIVIDTTGPVAFKEGFLPALKAKGLPRRFYIDIEPAIRKNGLPDSIDIRDGLLRGVRIGQFNKNTVRVVCDLGGSRKVKAFYLEDPFRVIIDAFGEQYSKGTMCPIPKRQEEAKEKTPSVLPRSSGAKNGGRLSIARQLGLCVRRVVIDPGHGGKDPGAIGPTGLQEKEVTLRIARKVAERLKSELGCDVILTRHDDVFLPLEQRTAIANAKKADLFVSIHANAAPDPSTEGVETYFLNFAVDKDAMNVAARENATSSKRMGELHSILNNILKNTKVNESSRLAGFVQKDLIKELDSKFGDVKNLGVKQAPFFVLIGAQMPSILVETSFISNPEEEHLLREDRYVDRIADGIADGIRDYSKDITFASSK
ncbi:MAG: N-acetylmuramoyl-L-alanine amidase [Desulfobacteraceae bacterium]|nr:N-acetylmuramoyl-L-alanine amidase [Desulfobacteraceae bacterium]